MKVSVDVQVTDLDGSVLTSVVDEDAEGCIVVIPEEDANYVAMMGSVIELTDMIDGVLVSFFRRLVDQHEMDVNVLPAFAAGLMADALHAVMSDEVPASAAREFYEA